MLCFLSFRSSPRALRGSVGRQNRLDDHLIRAGAPPKPRRLVDLDYTSVVTAVSTLDCYSMTLLRAPGKSPVVI